MLSTLKDRLARYRAERRLSPVSRKVRAQRLTYLSPHRLRTLERCAETVEDRGVAGDFVEAGVALGGSAVVLGAAMGPSLREHVARTFAAFEMPVGDRVRLHEGLFEDTLHPDAPVALAHVDSDWHDPVATCLERIAPQLTPGGFIVLDDYDDYGGCRDATDAFLAEDDRFALARLGTSVAVVHA